MRESLRAGLGLDAGRLEGGPTFHRPPPAARGAPFAPGAAAAGDASVPERDLRHLLGWFILVRWVFVGALLLAIAGGALVLRLEFPVGKALAVAVMISTYNVLFAAYHRVQSRWSAAVSTTGTVEAGLQIGLDLVALTGVIHFLGGATSPLVCLYLIHAIAAVMLLPRRAAWLVGAGAFLLFLSLLALEWSPQQLPPSHLSNVSGGAGNRISFEVVLAVLLLVTLAASMEIASTIMEGLRLRERQLQEAYASLSEKQVQLVQTEKHASLGRLVAGIAHEINNPIQFINGNMALVTEAFADVLPLLDVVAAQEPGLRVARLEYAFFRKQLPVLLQDMADGAERIGAIVRELRNYARNDEGRLDEPVDLATVVQAALRLLHNQLKHVRVELDLDPAAPPIVGNVGLMQQVMVNTLQNAYQALPRDGSGRIAVRLRAVDGAAVKLSVEDNGCGIPPEIRDRIFDPFFTTRQAAGGTGLGLAIIEGIVHQHRGQIQLESEVGRGTTFHFLFPSKGREAA